MRNLARQKPFGDTEWLATAPNLTKPYPCGKAVVEALR
jgi:hypothetical protein